MLEGDNPEEQAAERHAQLQELAQTDERMSRLLGYEFGTFTSKETGRPIVQIHNRDGEYVGFRGSDGERFVVPSNTIIYRYDEQGRLMERFIAGNLPEGYTPLTPAEIQRNLFRLANVPQVGEQNLLRLAKVPKVVNWVH